METVGRAIFMYAFLLIVFRLGDKRTLAQTTPFDLVLLLVIAEAAQPALVGSDYSMTTAALVVITLVGLDIMLSLLRLRFRVLEKVVDDAPLVLVEHGRPIRALMEKARVDTADIMEAARRLHGLERLSQVKYAVLETNGGISVVPAGWASSAPAPGPIRETGPGA
jgi:uncharacterized membrane protein YcaP (DUF421 family)